MHRACRWDLATAAVTCNRSVDLPGSPPTKRAEPGTAPATNPVKFRNAAGKAGQSSSDPCNPTKLILLPLPLLEALGSAIAYLFLIQGIPGAAALALSRPFWICGPAVLAHEE